MDVSTTADALRQALSQILRQDVSTSLVDSSLNYKISPELTAQYNEIVSILSSFSTVTDFKSEKTNLQLVGMKFRMLLARTTDEFIQTNEDINRISREQMTFIQNLTIVGGKLQSYNQLLATASNHAKIYDKLREAAILSTLNGQDALDYLRKTRDSQTNNPTRSDIKELVTTNKSFESLVGLDNIVSGIRQKLINIDIGLVESFSFYIFYGIPGTGKTAISEAIATQFSNGEYFKFDQSFFASTYLGVTESRIRNIFEMVRSNPNKRYTIIIDEADNVMGTVPRQIHLNSVKILLQTEISSYNSFGPNLMLVGITNYLSQIDQTFRRRATDIVNIPPPSIEECLNFLELQLTDGGEERWPPIYRTELMKGFDPNYVYTNSDMGRLAKNVRDNFLLSMAPSNEEIIIELFTGQRRLILFYPVIEGDKYRPARLPTETSEKIVGTYGNAIRNLASRLSSLSLSLQSFRKYFAPNVNTFQLAISRASSLRNADKEQYLQE